MLRKKALCVIFKLSVLFSHTDQVSRISHSNFITCPAMILSETQSLLDHLFSGLRIYSCVAPPSMFIVFCSVVHSQ
jgi:hypothetical protein